MTSEPVTAYTASARYGDDLAAAQRVWSGDGVIEAAGSLVLLTYFALPRLLAVRPAAGGSLRAVIDGHRERDFMETVLGLGGSAPGGIAHPPVRDRIAALAARHLAYPGMTGADMDFVSGLLALAPLRILAQQGTEVSATDRDGYWRYIGHVMGLLGSDLATPAATGVGCTEFAQAHAGRCAEGAHLITGFARRHPRHVDRALAAMFPQVRRVVTHTLARSE